MSYLLASDFDGTLIHWPSGKIDDEDREAIKRFRKAGNKVVVITGRMFRSAMDGFKAADFHDMDAFMCLSGAYCAHPDGTEIFDRRKSAERLPEIAEFFKSTGARYMNIDVGRESFEYDIGGEVSFGFRRLTKEELLALDTFTSMNVGYKNEDEAYKICRTLEKEFGDMITPLQNKNAIDMPPAGINKAVASSFAGEMYKVPKENVFTVGDSFNDLDMVREFNGSAMDTGPDELKGAAKRTVHRVREIIDVIMEERNI